MTPIPTVRRWTSPASACNNSGLGSLSLTTNPGSVTFTDTGTAGGNFTYTVNDGDIPPSTDTANVTVIRDTNPSRWHDRERHPAR